MSDHGPRVLALRETFAERFGRPCEVVARAPGRVNLIGEHTDYNDGLVLPIALEQCTWAAASARRDGMAHVWSAALRDARSWPAPEWRPSSKHDWSAYIAGVALVLAERGIRTSGFDLLIESEVPVGGGLSSSAALELSTALALTALVRRRLEPVELADVGRAAEHRYAGVPCGIMDQYVSALARADAALLLDCRTRTWQHVPLRLGDHVVVVIDSGTSHNLAAGQYAARRAECDEAVRRLNAIDPSVRALRDVSAVMLAVQQRQLAPPIAARARHVVTEIARTCDAADALGRGDIAALGDLLDASHRSLREDFEVSTPAIDRLVDLTRTAPGVRGARMTGGGFGGSIVAVVERDTVDALRAVVESSAAGETAVQPRVVLCRAGGGATVVYGMED